MNRKIDIKVDPEFEALIPPMSKEEFEQLRENILEVQEVYDPLILWNGTLIDGHNRWKIIQENPDVSYKTTEVIFFNRNEAILWIINNQLGRRNLNKADAILLAKRRGEVIAEEAKEKQAEAGKKNLEAFKSGISSVKNDKTNESPIDTRKEIAKLAGVSTGTVAQFEQVQKKAPELVDKIRSGEMTIGGAYKAVKEEEKAIPQEPTIEPPKYTIEDLIAEISMNTDGYVQFVRRTLTEHSTMLQGENERKSVREVIINAKAKLEELENLLK